MGSGSFRRTFEQYARPLAAAVLNASGLGAGYAYLRRWGALVVYWIGVLIWFGAVSNNVIWLVIIVVWVAISVVRGWSIAASADAAASGAAAPPPGEQVVTLSAPGRRGGAWSTRRRDSAWSSRRRRPWLALTVGAVLLVLVGLSIVGYRSDAREELRAGDAAHADGDCAEAIRRYDTVTSDYAFTFTSAIDRADERRRACELLRQARRSVAAEDFEGALRPYDDYVGRGRTALFAEEAAAELATTRARFAQQLIAEGTQEAYLDAYDQYLTLVQDHPESPEAATVPESVRAMYETATAGYREQRFCESVETLAFFAEFPPDDGLSDGIEAEARAALPGAQEGCELQQIQEEIEDLRTGAQGLPPPTPAGAAPGGTVTVEIVNGSNEPLEVLYTGPQTGRANLDACGDCGSSFGPVLAGTCGTTNSPRQTLTLAPGTYNMVVKTTGATVTPFYGSWPLAAGTAYSECYYIQTTF